MSTVIVRTGNSLDHNDQRRNLLHFIVQLISTCLTVDRVIELVDWRWNLQSLLEHTLLPLHTDISGPFHKTAQVTGWLDILTNSEIPWPLFEQGVPLFLGLNFLRS